MAPPSPSAEAMSSVSVCAQPQEGQERLAQEPSTYGRVNEGAGEKCIKSRGVPKKRTRCRVRWGPVLQYLLCIIQRQGVLTQKNVLHFSSSKIYFLSSSLVVLDFPIKPHGFLTILKFIKKTSLRTLIALLFFCSFFLMPHVLHKSMQTPFFLMSRSNKFVFFALLDNSKTVIKPI